MTGTTSRVDPSAHQDDHQRELLKEAATMALYVAICVLAALTVASHGEVAHRTTVMKIVWGTTLGLALAHWFAFRLSSRLVAAGGVRRSDAELAVTQFAGSIVVAIFATVPMLVFDGDAELDAARWVMAGFVGAVGYYVARGSGASTLRSLVYASTTMIVALAIVLVKNLLSGH